MKVFIIQPFIESEDRTKELEAEAAEYLTSLGHEVADFDVTGLVENLINENQSGGDINVYPVMIGITCALSAIAGAVYFGKGWREVPYCHDIFHIVFKYGLNIIPNPDGV